MSQKRVARIQRAGIAVLCGAAIVWIAGYAPIDWTGRPGASASMPNSNVETVQSAEIPEMARGGTLASEYRWKVWEAGALTVVIVYELLRRRKAWLARAPKSWWLAAPMLAAGGILAFLLWGPSLSCTWHWITCGLGVSALWWVRLAGILHHLVPSHHPGTQTKRKVVTGAA